MVRQLNEKYINEGSQTTQDGEVVCCQKTRKWYDESIIFISKVYLRDGATVKEFDITLGDYSVMSGVEVVKETTFDNAHEAKRYLARVEVLEVL